MRHRHINGSDRQIALEPYRLSASRRKKYYYYDFWAPDGTCIVDSCIDVVAAISVEQSNGSEILALYGLIRCIANPYLACVDAVDRTRVMWIIQYNQGHRPIRRLDNLIRSTYLGTLSFICMAG